MTPFLAIDGYVKKTIVSRETWWPRLPRKRLPLVSETPGPQSSTPHRPPSWGGTMAIPCGRRALAPAQPLSPGSRGRSPVSVPGPDHPQSPQHRSLTQFTNSSRKPAVCPSPPSSSPTTTNMAGCSRVDGRRLGIPEERDRLRSPDTCETRPVRQRVLPRGPGCRKGFRE